MLGQRADARNGEQRLQLVEVALAVDVDEVDDLVHVLTVLDMFHRASVVTTAVPFGAQLLEMRAHVLARGRQQRRRETIIDGFGDRLHGRVPGAKRGDHLPLALAPVLEVAGEERARIVDARPCAGSSTRGSSAQNALERRR